jgi:hypothetical protein
MGWDQETPLWYYVLKESEVQSNGNRLGEVGGRIVGEVLVGLLDHDPSSFRASRPDWCPELPSRVAGKFTSPKRAIGSAPVFPAPKDPTKACDRHLLDHWLRRAFTKAGLVTERGGLWHTLRRKWATERKGYPVKDVAAAGGWRDERTILTSYQQVDAATVKQVVLSPTQRLLGS